MENVCVRKRRSKSTRGGRERGAEKREQMRMREFMYRKG